MKSIKSKLMYKVLSFVKNKTIFGNEKKLLKHINDKKNNHKEDYKAPKIIKVFTHQDSYKGMTYYILNKKGLMQKKDNKLIFYLHGGGYMVQPVVFHWLFLRKLARKTKTTIVFPIYPKAPVSGYKEAYQKVEGLYLELLKNNYIGNVTIMGDSSGGGFALGLTMKLRDEKLRLPNQLILISPWLDMTLTNKKIKYYEAKDPSLEVDKLRKIRLYWANQDNLKSYLLSPIYGILSKLPPITVFTGENEILYPDCMLLQEKCKKENTPIELISNENMYHCYPLFPLKDGKVAIEKMSHSIRNGAPIWLKNKK